jgi:hypothetical protein
MGVKPIEYKSGKYKRKEKSEHVAEIPHIYIK